MRNPRISGHLARVLSPRFLVLIRLLCGALLIGLLTASLRISVVNPRFYIIFFGIYLYGLASESVGASIEKDQD